EAGQDQRQQDPESDPEWPAGGAATADLTRWGCPAGGRRRPLRVRERRGGAAHSVGGHPRRGGLGAGGAARTRRPAGRARTAPAGAGLRRTRMTRARMTGARLTRARLTRLTRTRLSGAGLTRSRLAGARLAGGGLGVGPSLSGDRGASRGRAWLGERAWWGDG